MKQTFFYCFLITAFLSTGVKTYAQTEKGKILLGGQSSLEFTSFSSKWETDSGSGDNGKTRALDITPQVGYFIANNFAVGLEMPYNYSKEIDGDDSYTTSSFTVVPFVRYYFGKSNLKPYLHGGIGPGWGKTEIDYNSISDPNFVFDPNFSTHLLAYELGGGIAIFLNDLVSLEFGLGYASASVKWFDKNDKMNRKNTANGIGASIGIVVSL